VGVFDGLEPGTGDFPVDDGLLEGRLVCLLAIAFVLAANKIARSSSSSSEMVRNKYSASSQVPRLINPYKDDSNPAAGTTSHHAVIITSKVVTCLPVGTLFASKTA
jgi:hypothetical protein